MSAININEVDISKITLGTSIYPTDKNASTRTPIYYDQKPFCLAINEAKTYGIANPTKCRYNTRSISVSLNKDQSAKFNDIIQKISSLKRNGRLNSVMYNTEGGYSTIYPKLYTELNNIHKIKTPFYKDDKRIPPIENPSFIKIALDIKDLFFSATEDCNYIQIKASEVELLRDAPLKRKL